MGGGGPQQNGGAVFKITPEGSLTGLHSFGSPEGNPGGGVVLAADGSFYGAAANEGGASCGLLYNISPGGTFTPLHSFDMTDGCNPYATPVQATDGNLYGTTRAGGANGYGTVFAMTPGGTLTTLHSFDLSDGNAPYGALLQAKNGDLYGTTNLGGSNGYGTIFETTLEGALTTLHNFDSTDGRTPYAGLIQATNGGLYGTTTHGGANGNAYGTTFKVTPEGALTTLHSFGPSGGFHPYAPLVQATDGNFYGVNANGLHRSAQEDGTIFRMAADGKLTTLHSFNQKDAVDGSEGGLTQGTDGNLYGTTFDGGPDGCGTVFRLSVGLGPFVKTVPGSGPAGATINILGTNLSGATGVEFNGTAAAFTIVSSTQITATVPAGAATGTVKVTMPGSTLSSNVAFRVTP